MKVVTVVGARPQFIKAAAVSRGSRGQHTGKMYGRMDTLQCAVVLAKMGRFEWEMERRIVRSRQHLSGNAGICPHRPEPAVGADPTVNGWDIFVGTVAQTLAS